MGRTEAPMGSISSGRNICVYEIIQVERRSKRMSCRVRLAQDGDGPKECRSAGCGSGRDCYKTMSLRSA